MTWIKRVFVILLAILFSSTSQLQAAEKPLNLSEVIPSKLSLSVVRAGYNYRTTRQISVLITSALMKFADKKVSIGIGGYYFLTHSFHLPTVFSSGNIQQNSANVLHYPDKFGGTCQEKPKKPTKNISNGDVKQGITNDN